MTSTGVVETLPDDVRRSLTLDGEWMTSHANGEVSRGGRLETPSLAELSERVRDVPAGKRIAVREVVADVQALHADASNAGALFQVASQFDLLEMTSPEVIP
jgi:hypothetical protein